MRKKITRVPLKPKKVTSADLRIFKKLARKIADNAVNQPFDAHNNQIAACCDFLIQEIKEGEIFNSEAKVEAGRFALTVKNAKSQILSAGNIIGLWDWD
jgi:hypothetical protein